MSALDLELMDGIGHSAAPCAPLALLPRPIPRPYRVLVVVRHGLCPILPPVLALISACIRS